MEFGRAEVEVGVELFLEEAATALGVVNIFGGIAADFELNGYGAALERGFQVFDTLAMRMVEAFGDTQDGGEAANDAFVGIIEPGIGRVIGIRRGLAVVIADDGGNDVAVTALKARDVAIEREILAMLVVAAVADAVPDVVKQRAGFEQHAGLGRQVMQ